MRTSNFHENRIDGKYIKFCWKATSSLGIPINVHLWSYLLDVTMVILNKDLAVGNKSVRNVFKRGAFPLYERLLWNMFPKGIEWRFSTLRNDHIWSIVRRLDVRLVKVQRMLYMYTIIYQYYECNSILDSVYTRLESSPIDTNNVSAT